MFTQLSDRLKGVFDTLTGRGSLSEADVKTALRELRVALLEADVALPAIKQLLAKVKEEAVGEAVLKSVTPGQQVVKIVHDALVDLLGEGEDLNLNAPKPVVILMAGLQGSGKTTTTAKLARRLIKLNKKRVMLASTDIYRPAAQEQLQTLAEKVEADFMPITEGEQPVAIAKRALAEAKKSGADVLFIDTAGRLELDDDLMTELVAVQEAVQPTETLLVADSLTGQTAVNIADAFNKAVNITGLILTRLDGDGRGGAALSMRTVTGVPIKFIGLGEDVGALESFRPEGIADRILGQGDVVALVEKAATAIDEEDALKMQEKMMSGSGLDLNDLKKQLQMMLKMAGGGGLGGLMGLMPGMGKLMKQVDASKLDSQVVVHQIAVIDSMTKAERRNPSLLNARRRQRIAKGAGVEVSTVNKLVKMHEQMNRAMKQLKKMGGMGALAGMMGGGKMPGPFGR